MGMWRRQDRALIHWYLIWWFVLFYSLVFSCTAFWKGQLQCVPWPQQARSGPKEPRNGAKSRDSQWFPLRCMHSGGPDSPSPARPWAPIFWFVWFMSPGLGCGTGPKISSRKSLCLFKLYLVRVCLMKKSAVKKLTAEKMMGWGLL